MFRIGHGYDLHRLEPYSTWNTSGGGQPLRALRLGGVAIEHDRGVVAHSDGDALLHAVTDALLGAAGLPDLGSSYPDRDPVWAGADSALFLRETAGKIRAARWAIENIDATVILEKPKVAPHKEAIRASIAALLEIEAARVNVKGKTHEKVDAVGEGRAIEVHVVALLRYAGP
jgi:2-C-methyl-D-erythritol 2,4-cyclodiphosphate synthase